jgi:outer membrane autotransporter protein
VKVSANDVSGGTYGIRVLNKYGRGSLSITATGTVSGASADGIFARNVSGIDLTISANDVSGGRNGIYAIDGRGVVTINAAAVSGDTNGIFAKSSYGTISITTTGSVEGQSGAGIYAYRKAGFSSSSMTISATDVSGGGDGIHAFNGGIFYGHLSITATGTVTGGTGDGISAVNLAGGMTISTADVSGGRNGISAQNLLGGDLVINTAAVSGGRNGVSAQNMFGGNLVINTAAVSGGDNGILAYNAALGGGAGSLSITATGTVTGSRYDGINASNYGSGSLTIDVADVSGNIDGIHALNKNGGALSIAASGTVEGKTGAGISASNEFGTTDLTISAAGVSGAAQGIYARNIGTGAVSITATGKVSGGTGHDGIFVRNNGNGATIKTEAVSGGANGINVDNLGIGAVSITAKGTVEGTSGRGISVVNEPGSSDLTISAAAVSGGSDGIYARNVGYGSTFITTTGTVTGKGASGIYARSNASNAILTISTEAVSGAQRGMDIKSFGNGLASITATGTVTGHGAEGINVFKYSSGDLKIDTADVSGATDGIHILNGTGGAISITTRGAVEGAAGAGIFVQNKGVAADSTTTVMVKSSSFVSGHTNGVEVRSATGRAATVVNAGTITGTTGVLANGGPMTVFNTGIITGTGGTAIDLTGAGHPSTVNQQGGAITGKILLSAASDTVNVTGGAIAGNIVGQGNANLNFALGSGTFTFAAPYAVTGMEGVFMNSGTVTIAGTINTDALTVNGGTMIVEGKVTTFPGFATVNGGKLVVGDDTHATATLAGDVLVKSGGTLAGIGTVGATAIMAGGIHAPGNNSLGTQTINGNYTNNGTLQIYMTPTLSSQVTVNGAVDISGATLSLMPSPAFAADFNSLNGPFTIIANDGGDAVTGTFSSVTGPLLFFDDIVDYAGGDGNDVTLELIRNGLQFADVAHTPNQKAAADGVDSLGRGNPLWNAIILQGDGGAARAAFDRLSGEIYASTRSALIEDSHFVRDAVNDRIRSAFGDLSAPAMPVMAYGEGGPQFAPPDSAGPVAWGHAFGSWGSFDGDGNAAAMGTSTGGFLTGIDGEIASDVRLGFLTGYSHSTFDIDGRYSSGSSDNYHVGLYAGGKWNALRLTGGLAYTWHDIKTGRSVAFPGFGDSLTGNYGAGTFQAFGEAGYKIGIGAISFEPFANLAYVNLHTNGFTEKGGDAALRVRGETTETTFTTRGVHLASVFDIGGMKATARATLGWRHAFGDVTPISTNAFAGGSAFDIAGVPVAKDAALVEAGFDLNLTEAATLGIAYQGQFGSGAMQNGFNANLQVRF